MEYIGEVLKEINRDPGINQRSLSSLCSISLGKINALIDDIEQNGFITKEIKGREHRYFITEKGLEFLEQLVRRSKEAIIDLHISGKSEVKTAVILAAGRNPQFIEPACLQSIEEITLIERLVNQLTFLGIKNIIVVGGYCIEKVRHILPKHVIVVTNEDYKWTGTMASLSKVNPYISEDFLLIEGDIVIETMGLKEIIADDNRDSVLITAESGSGDEAFVEIRNNRIFRISKDICQLNRIDGEMIGISKLSYKYFTKMMELYEDNQNPYLNYEYLMLDVSQIYFLGYKKMDNLLWHEVDDVRHLDLIQTKLMKRIHKKEKILHLESLKELISECLNIDVKRVRDIVTIGGMTNKNYKVIIDDKKYVLRVPGNGTEKMISRIDEIKNAAFAHEIGVDADLIYFNEETGIKISNFIEDAQTLSAEGAKKPYVMKKVCQLLKKLHQCGREMENEFNVYAKIEAYEQLLNELKGEYYDDYQSVKQKVLKLRELMDGLEINLTPCHNDTLAENFIKDKNGRYYLIDWEYAGMNDPMWDVAAHCLENGFNSDEEELFVKTYFNEEPQESYKTRLLINKIYQDFLWSLWTKVKEASGDDFGNYGVERYNRAKENLNLLMENLEG